MKKRGELPAASEALPGRETPIPTADRHFVFKTPLKGPYPDGMKMAMFGMGCFWGAERKFWQMEGVCNTAVGYSAGHTPNPTYEEVCSGQTAHNEVVRVVFDPDQTSYKALLKTFWESHNPTQFMAQGNDLGTQYRSGIYFFSDAQREEAEKSLELYQNALNAKNMGDICTEIVEAGPFYFAEDYHQQYLAKKPDGYCGLGGTGISCSL